MHPSVRVESDHRHPLQAGDRVHPQRQLRQIGVNPTDLALLWREDCPVLADGPGMSRKDRGELGLDLTGPQSLRHRLR